MKKAKLKAKKIIHRLYKDQYGILYDFVNELKRTNPNTIVKVLTFKENDGIERYLHTMFYLNFIIF